MSSTTPSRSVQAVDTTALIGGYVALGAGSVARIAGFAQGRGMPLIAAGCVVPMLWNAARAVDRLTHQHGQSAEDRSADARLVGETLLGLGVMATAAARLTYFAYLLGAVDLVITLGGGRVSATNLLPLGCALLFCFPARASSSSAASLRCLRARLAEAGSIPLFPPKRFQYIEHLSSPDSEFAARITRELDHSTGNTVVLKEEGATHMAREMIETEWAVGETLKRDAANDPDLVYLRQVLERFEREGITRQGQKPLVLTVEDIEGVDLYVKIRHGRLDPHLAASLFAQYARGTDLLARCGWVHWDLMPVNLMVTTFGTGKIIDLGLAGRIGQRWTGMPLLDWRMQFGHMAPEIFVGELPSPDQRAGVFCLGASLFEVLTQRRAYNVWGLRHLHHFQTLPPRLSEVIPCDFEIRQRALNALYDDVIARALAYHPDNRFQSGAEFGKALLRWSCVHDLIRF